MTYSITVRNELTGELAVLEVEAGDVVEAQCQALIVLFTGRGWRKATALVPDGAQPGGWKEEWQRFVDGATAAVRPAWLPAS